MKTLESSEEKIQDLCDRLRTKTLDPAKQEAEEILREARTQAEAIILKAEEKRNALIEEGRETVQKQEQVFQSSLEQSGRMAIEQTKQVIGEGLFDAGLHDLLHAGFNDAKIVGELVNAVVDALGREGFGADLNVEISKALDPEEVAKHLASSTLAKIHGGKLTVGPFDGGARLKVGEKQVTVDITGESLKELMARFVRKNFRTLLFGE